MEWVNVNLSGIVLPWTPITEKSSKVSIDDIMVDVLIQRASRSQD